MPLNSSEITEANMHLRPHNLYVGYKFTDGKGHIFTIKGYVSRRPKAPVQIETPNGQKFKCSIDFVKNGMSMNK